MRPRPRPRTRFAIGSFLVILLVAVPIAGSRAGDAAGAEHGAAEPDNEGTPAPGAAAPGKRGKVLFYRSPMDPSFVSRNPGKDAMGMDMVPVYEGDPEANLSEIAIAPGMLQKIGVRTAVVQRGPLSHTVRSVARIDYDERTLTEVSMKFDGWIESLSVDETGAWVEKGSQLFEIYSPELVASQDEFLLSVRTAATGPHRNHIEEAGRHRLEQYDLTDAQIEEIIARGKPLHAIPIVAPASGYVIHKSVIEGTFVRRGTPLFRLSPLSTVWVYVDLFEYEAPWVRAGQPAEMELTYAPGTIYRGRIDYVYPFLDEKSRTIGARIIFDNPGLRLKPGMFATVRIETVPVEDAIIVPSEAVLRSGVRDMVFIALGGGRFEPRDVVIGLEGDGGDYQVVSGLSEGEEIVVSGQLLLDSESRLKEAVAKMLGVEPRSPAPEPAP